MGAYVFPGQGSQSVGMGEKVFPRFASYVRHANEILGYSVEELCSESKGGRLSQTQFTQPALYVVNALTYLAKRADGEFEPSCFAGHSLGEYCALFAAGVIDFATGLELVKQRGELMAAAPPGGMAAVIGLTLQQVQELISRPELSELDIANLNTQQQLVLSGPRETLARAQDIFERAGATLYAALNVGGAFHSRYMRRARDAFADFIRPFAVVEPSKLVVSNVRVTPYTASNAKQLLVEQITSPVDWFGTIEWLLDRGEDPIVECGPGSVLTGMLQHIRKGRAALAAAPEPAKRTQAPESVRGFDGERSDVLGRRTGRASERVMDSLRDVVLEILPDVRASQIDGRARLRDLGADSVERAEVLTSVMQRLRVRMPLTTFAHASNIEEIAGILSANLPA